MLTPLLLLSLGAGTQFPAAMADTVEPRLIEHMAELPATQHVPVIVVMEDRMDLQGLILETRTLRKADRRTLAMERMRAHADASQAGLTELLDELESEGRISYRAQLWNVNAHRVTIEAGSIERIAALPGVAYLRHAAEHGLGCIDPGKLRIEELS